MRLVSALYIDRESGDLRSAADHPRLKSIIDLLASAKKQQIYKSRTRVVFQGIGETDTRPKVQIIGIPGTRAIGVSWARHMFGGRHM